MGCASRLCSLYRRLTGSAVLLSSLPRKIPGPAPPSSSRPPLLLPIANRSNLFTVRPTAAATPFLGLSALSTFSAAGVDLSEHQSSFSHGQQDSVVSEFSEQIYIPVKAYFLCTSFDLKGLQAENAYNVIPPASRSSNYLVLRFCDIPPEVAGFGVLENGDCYRYMVVFQYGSAVLFNIADNDVERYLELARRHASGLLPEMRKDDYAVVQKPQLETWMQGGLDYIVLKNLDIDGIRIIGSVLGQSIALDYFVRQVDGMVEEFTDINRGMEKTGTFTMQRKKLFQLVGKANSNLADVILKLGLFERYPFYDEYSCCSYVSLLYSDGTKGSSKLRYFINTQGLSASVMEWLNYTISRHKLLMPLKNTLPATCFTSPVFCYWCYRSEIAWRNANYAQIWEYLRDEYELTQRFGSLDFKLKFVEHNIHFLQEILQNRKSDFLEWCIILLISLEIVISVYEIVRRSPISPL